MQSSPASTDIPVPSPMPGDSISWGRELHLSNFINAYYQYRDLQGIPDCERVLIVGPGQGLDTAVLRWRGYQVTTFDIDTTFNPDVTGSVHDLSLFSDRAFDAVIASHVLEHLPEPYLDQSLSELARVARYSLIYLPVRGRHLQLRLIPGFKGLDLSFVFDLANWFQGKPDGVTRRYMAGMHYWEVGMKGFKLESLTSRFERMFIVLRSYRNKDWLPSYNFLLKSRLHSD